MKKVIFSLACMAFLAACNQKQSSPAPDVQSDNIASFALPLDTAVSYTQRYDSLAQVFLDVVPIKSYTIRATDLMEAMGMPKDCAASARYDHVRVYIGMDAENKFRLLLTPVEGADITKGIPGSDFILSGQYISGSNPSGPVLEGQYVMDFTGPCPNSCTSNSPFTQVVGDKK